MSTEFLADASERLIQTMRQLGIGPEVAGLVAAEWGAGIVRDWGGERPYIGKGGPAQREMSQRDKAILHDWQAGERIATLVRKYGIKARRVRQIIAGGNVLP